MSRPVLLLTPSGVTPATAIDPADVELEVLVALDAERQEVPS